MFYSTPAIAAAHQSEFFRGADSADPSGARVHVPAAAHSMITGARLGDVALGLWHWVSNSNWHWHCGWHWVSNSNWDWHCGWHWVSNRNWLWHCGWHFVSNRNCLWHWHCWHWHWVSNSNWLWHWHWVSNSNWLWHWHWRWRGCGRGHCAKQQRRKAATHRFRRSG